MATLNEENVLEKSIWKCTESQTVAQTRTNSTEFILQIGLDCRNMVYNIIEENTDVVL